MKRFVASLLLLAASADFARADDAPAPLARYGSEGEPDRPDSLRAVAMSPTGRLVALAGEPETPTGSYAAQIRDAATGRLLHTLGGHEGPIRSLAFSPRGDWLATVTSDADGLGVTRLFEVATGKLARPVEAGGRLVRFLPDGRLLVAGFGRVSYFDPGTGREVGRAPATPVVKDATADGRRALGVSHHGQAGLEVRDLGTGRPVVQLAGCTAEPPAAVFSPDGRSVAAVDPRSKSVLVWEVLTGQIVRRIAAETTVTSLAFAPGGRSLLAGGLDRTIRTWEVATGEPTGRLAGHGGAVMALAPAPGERLLSGSTDRSAILWPLAELERSTLPAGPLSPADLDAAWSSLAGNDAATAYRSLGLIAARPAELLPELFRRVERQVVPVPDADLARRIAGLGHTDYRVREEATASLLKAGDAVRPHLERALAAAGSPEVRSRLRLVLRRVGSTPRFTPGDLLRLRRLIGEVGSLGGRDAERLLRLLSDEFPEAAVAAEAREALRRIAP